MNQLQALQATIALAAEHEMPELAESGLGLAHLRSMYKRAQEFQSDEAKLGRWLGWAQCAVVAANIGVTLEDMKTLNRVLDEAIQR